MAHSQSAVTYRFDQNLLSSPQTFIPLDIVGPKGTFVLDYAPFVHRDSIYVYKFPLNSGLVFNNQKLDDFITGSYTIEMYFKYDDGELLIYNQLLGDHVKDKQGQYVHLAVSRDADTQRVVVYIDGKKSTEFFDLQNQLAMNGLSKITFFAQEGTITTGGSVALIRIYNYYINSDRAQSQFAAFRNEKSTGR